MIQTKKTTPKKNQSLSQLGTKSVSPQQRNYLGLDLINSSALSDIDSSTQYMFIQNQNDQSNYQNPARNFSCMGKNKKQKSRIFSANISNRKFANSLNTEDQNQNNYNAFIKYLQDQIDRSSDLPPKKKNKIFGETSNIFTPKNDNHFFRSNLDKKQAQGIYQKKFQIGDAQQIQLQEHQKIRASSRMYSTGSTKVKRGELLEQIQIMQSQIARLDYQNINFRTQIQQQNEQMKHKDSFIQDLMKQQKLFQQSPIISGIGAFQDDSTSLQSDQKNIKSENATNTSSKKNIKTPYSSFKEQRGAKVDNSQVIELKELIQEKNDEIEALRGNAQKLLAAQDEIKKYKSEIKQLKQSSQTQALQIDQMKQQTNTSKQDVYDQQLKAIQTPAMVSDLGSNKDYLEQIEINDSLKKEIQQLNFNNEQSSVEIKDLKEEINKLKDTIHQNTLSEMIFQDKIKSLYYQISELQKTVIQTNQDFIQFQEQMKQQSNQKQQKEEEVQKEQVKDEKIFEEIQKIQSKLLEWDCAFSDDRSDIQSAISQIVAPEQNNSNFIKFGSPKRNTSLYSKQHNFVAVIEQESENDSNSQNDDNVSHIQFASDSQPNSSTKINSSMTQIKFLGQMGRSNTESGLKQGFSQFRRQQTHIQKMNDQINRINNVDCTIVTDDASHYGGVSQFHRIAQENNSYKTVFVEKNNPVVQISFQRIARLQQIKRISIDQIEIEIFGKQLKTYKSISIQQLTQVFINKLDLSTSEAILFSRFLIEEPTDEQEESGDRSVQFEIERKANAQLIAVRLMAHSFYPRIYSSQNDKAALDSFELAFKTLKQKYNLVQKVLNNQSRIITFDQFKYFIEQSEKSSEQDLKENIIECAFIILSRACSDTEIQNLPKDKLFQMFQGFIKENILVLFRNKYTLEDLKKEEPRLIFGHSNQESSRQSEQNVDFTPVIGGKMLTGQFPDYEESSTSPINIDNQTSEIKNKPKLYIGISMIDIPYNPNQVNNNFKKQQTQENIINKDKMIDHSPKFKELSSPRRMKKDIQSFGQVTVHNSSDHGEQKSQSTEIKHKVSPEFSEKRLENIPEEKDRTSQDLEIPQYSDSRSEDDFDMQESMGFKTTKLQNKLNEVAKEMKKQDKEEDQIFDKVQQEVINLYMSFCAKSQTYRTQQNMYQNLQLDSILNSFDPTIEQANEIQNQYLNKQNQTCDTNFNQKDEIVQEDDKTYTETQQTLRESPKNGIIDKLINPSETLQTLRMTTEKIITESQVIIIDNKFDKLFGQLISNKLYSFFISKTKSAYNVLHVLSRLALKMRGIQLLELDTLVKDSLWLINYDIVYKDANQLQYLTLRELFKDGTQSLVVQAKNSNYCFEVVKSSDFIGKINFILNQPIGQLNNNWRQNLPQQCLEMLDDYSTLDLDTINALLVVFQVPNHHDYINFTQLQKLFNLLGVQQLEIQDLQAQINYNLLDIQSIKILNKLIDFLQNMKPQENQQINQKTNQDQFTQNLLFLIEDIVTKQTVKTRTSNTEVQIFKANDFETKLQKFGIIDRLPVNIKLFEVLNIDKKYPSILMLKKLKKCLFDLKQNRYAISISTNMFEINFGQEKSQEDDQIEIYLESINHLIQTSKHQK